MQPPCQKRPQKCTPPAKNGLKNATPSVFGIKNEKIVTDFSYHNSSSFMAEKEGFEPPRDFHPLSVFKTDPFNRAWVFLHISYDGYYTS